ncbi:MAG: hypothetical protein ACKN9I_06770, partial [Alphaproteobacteria bacterium]
MIDHIFKKFLQKFLVQFFVIFFLAISQARAEIKVTNWSEISKINNNGRQSDFKIIIQVTNIPENSGISSFI